MFSYLVVLILIVILGSLGSALVFLLKDPNGSPRTVKALTTRISLSVGLFLLLLLAFQRGWIKPHGLREGLAQFAVKKNSSDATPPPPPEQRSAH